MESFTMMNIDNLTSTIIPGQSSVIISNILTTNGPQAMRQLMRYNNQTVVDKVPPEMLHLIHPYWLFFYYIC